MSSQQVEEAPSVTTAGLTSARQLTDMTSAVAFDLRNTAALVPEYVMMPSEEKAVREEMPPFREEGFEKVLRNSIRRNKDILDVLSKL